MVSPVTVNGLVSDGSTVNGSVIINRTEDGSGSGSLSVSQAWKVFLLTVSASPNFNVQTENSGANPET